MSNFEVSPEMGNKGNANLVYILYLVALVVGITSIIGVIMAYIGKDDADELTRSHYRNQIHIFWKGLLYSIVGGILCIVVIGFFILLVAFIWYIVRVIKGMDMLSKGKPYPNPESWGF